MLIPLWNLPIANNTSMSGGGGGGGELMMSFSLLRTVPQQLNIKDHLRGLGFETFVLLGKRYS